MRDPYRATIGLGLGIAGLNAGSAEDSLMNQVVYLRFGKYKISVIGNGGESK